MPAWNPDIRRWVVEAVDTAHEYVRELYDDSHPAGAGRSPRQGQQVFEGRLEDLQTAKAAAERRAMSRCSFCDGPKPCLRD